LKYFSKLFFPLFRGLPFSSNKRSASADEHDAEEGSEDWLQLRDLFQLDSDDELRREELDDLEESERALEESEESLEEDDELRRLEVEIPVLLVLFLLALFLLALLGGSPVVIPVLVPVPIPVLVPWVAPGIPFLSFSPAPMISAEPDLLVWGGCLGVRKMVSVTIQMFLLSRRVGNRQMFGRNVGKCLVVWSEAILAGIRIRMAMLPFSIGFWIGRFWVINWGWHCHLIFSALLVLPFSIRSHSGWFSIPKPQMSLHRTLPRNQPR
jgi:hypothetical protein